MSADSSAGKPEVPAPLHREEGLERQKGRPMWGCVRNMGCGSILLLLILIILGGVVYYYLGTSSFAETIRSRIEKNLEARLSRDVVIERVEVTRTSPQKVVLRGLKIANAAGSKRPWFVEVDQVVITGGVESFLKRSLSLGRIDISGVRFLVEVYPAGSKLQHNFPSWKQSAPRRFQIVSVDIRKMFVQNAFVEFLDYRHDLSAVAGPMSSEITPTFRQSIYAGTALTPRVVVKIQDYKPFEVDLRGAFLYKPGSLALQSVALRGRGIETFLSGELNPLTEAVYDFDLRGRVELLRIAEIFAIEKKLEGTISLDTKLRGKQGEFSLTGGFTSPAISADVYDLDGVRGKLDVNGTRVTLRIDEAEYGGGTVAADYLLTKYEEPYPMTVDLQYDGISIEKLFADWGTANTGLRGAATGRLEYGWNKDDILSGRGRGTAKLRPGTVAFGDAPYPMAIAGDAKFSLDAGVVRFRDSVLSTPQSNIAFAGTLRIEDLYSKLNVNIDSRDFSELDKVAFNFARIADKKDYELLGLGGAGTIAGTVEGTIEKPSVQATITAGGTMYNDVLLGHSSIDLRYDGARGVLTFDRSTFRNETGATLAMTGTITFPDRGPSPLFDLVVDAAGYPVERAMSLVDLEIKATGLGTGRLTVTGSPESGTVTFNKLTIAKGTSELDLNGDVTWLPGEGNVEFDLDLGARSFPISEIVAFLELGEIPVEGQLTGTLHLEGPKDSLNGAGAVIIRKGEVFGEPIDVASADISFQSGVARITAIEVRSAAGLITGEAEYNLSTETFSYLINAGALDIARFKVLAPLAKILQGKLNIVSSGAGSAEQPEIVLEGTISDPLIAGVEIPAGASIPKFYLAIRNGQIIIRASAFDVASVEGGGTVSPTGVIDANVRATLTDIGRFLRIFAAAPELPAEGNVIVDLHVGGKIESLETLTIEGAVPEMRLSLSGQEFVPVEPIRFSVKNGLARIDSFSIRHQDASFSLAGSVGLTGRQNLDLTVNGKVDAALIQLFAPDIRAEGGINVAAGITGTVDAPSINGTAEILDGELKIAGFPQLIDDIRGTLVFKGTRIEIDSLRATLGGGEVVAGGFVTLEGLSLNRVRMSLQGNDIILRYFEGISVEGDFSLLLSGDKDRIVLQGDVNVGRALYFKDFDLTASVLNLILERRGLAPAVAASWQDRVSLRVHLTADQTLAIKNNIGDVTGSAEIDVTGTLGNPVIIGLVNIDDGGKLRFQDVDYRVTRGTINFQNPFRIDPYFDISAEARVQEYDLTVNLTGTLDRITPSISSDPPISDLSLLALLGPSSIGQPRTGFGFTNESLQATGTSLLYQSLGGIIGAKILPFADAVRLDVDPLSTDPTVTFEKRINKDVRVIVIYNTSNNQNREIIEWQLTSDWIVELTRDSEQEDTYFINAVDARFRRRYPGYWK